VVDGSEYFAALSRRLSTARGAARIALELAIAALDLAVELAVRCRALNA